jgi:hypothetical protein
MLADWLPQSLAAASGIVALLDLKAYAEGFWTKLFRRGGKDEQRIALEVFKDGAERIADAHEAADLCATMETDNAARRVEQDVISSWAHHIAEFMEAHKEVGASADLYEVTEGVRLHVEQHHTGAGNNIAHVTVHGNAHFGGQ